MRWPLDFGVRCNATITSGIQYCCWHNRRNHLLDFALGDVSVLQAFCRRRQRFADKLPTPAVLSGDNLNRMLLLNNDDLTHKRRSSQIRMYGKRRRHTVSVSSNRLPPWNLNVRGTRCWWNHSCKMGIKKTNSENSTNAGCTFNAQTLRISPTVKATKSSQQQSSATDQHWLNKSSTNGQYNQHRII
jgi:hypothetical protein